jgi:hypothetical protein
MCRWICPKWSGAACRSFALAGVAVHHLDAAPRDAEAHGREAEALELEVAHHVEVASPSAPTRFSAGTTQSSKTSSAVDDARMPQLVLDLLPEREALHALLDDEHRELAASAPSMRA